MTATKGHSEQRRRMDILRDSSLFKEMSSLRTCLYRPRTNNLSADKIFVQTAVLDKYFFLGQIVGPKMHGKKLLSPNNQLIGQLKKDEFVSRSPKLKRTVHNSFCVFQAFRKAKWVFTRISEKRGIAKIKVFTSYRFWETMFVSSIDFNQ